MAELPEDIARLLDRAPGTAVIVRVPRPDALPVVVRTWRRESDVLRAVRGVLPHAPECLAEGDGFAIHSHVEGVPLSAVCANGTPVDHLIVRALADLLAQMTRVRLRSLPPLPPGWPAAHTDSQAFLRKLAHAADEQIRQPNWAVHGGLFAALGIPDDALSQLAERVPPMSRRPFSLLHADLHRDNLILAYGGGPPLVCVDWELATFGDPLYDLATHLVRMRYPEGQWPEVTEAWATAMRATRPAAVNGWAKDLRHYIRLERAQAAFADVMRAARTLEGTFEQAVMDRATEEVGRALTAAAEPLGLRGVPTAKEIEGALLRWQVSRWALSGAGTGTRVSSWRPDHRLGERPDFPHAAVTEALSQEGGAPASRVFKGTAHLNTVVRVPGHDVPVVVRRGLPDVSRREPRYLSEHRVLRAIELCGAPVGAPKALALGRDRQGEPFTVHTYEGPPLGRDDGIDQPPDHPVNGLLPHEADALVDQLCALTAVDHRTVDPTAGEGGFHPWLTRQLVALVAGLPRESRQLARLLGLPDADRLADILARHTVRERKPALLHGDLNPWNLVRRTDHLALTIIDWEMALVGDPLYDLVRHMHLTPTRPEIRTRMFTRWERGLDLAHTADWRQDWRVYRWLETVRSAYVDLDRLATGTGLDAPNVRRALASYAMTLAAAKAALGLPAHPTPNPYLTRALA
ncbi:aminoglycoside phosphotransferase family protein [Streptomyces sp. NPDC047000]|uniref:phosphotransferase family protein n=1 Tax=Streptomyces sp. NPDC047000 TaxID=3155474 RepID=UPI0034105FA9